MSLPADFPGYEYAYYYVFRNAARERVATAINQKVVGRRSDWNGLTLCSINKDAIDYARLEWPKYYSDKTHLGFVESWERLYFSFRNRPSFFDLAIWQQIGDERVLQALALGKPSHGKTHLSVCWVERYFGPTHLKGGVLRPILACAEEYAKLLGCERVLIKEAVIPEQYARYGYQPYKLPKVSWQYMCKELK